MQNGFYQATGAMATQLNRLNVISNNLANITTTGFKRDDVVISDFKRIYDEKMQDTSIKDNTKQAARFINQSLNRIPYINSEYTDFSSATIKKTGNTFDVALKNNDEFFMVRSADGQIRLSKDGSFTLDDDGFLINRRGEKILSANYFNNPANDGILLNPNAGEFQISGDGSIYQNDAIASNIFIAKVDDVRKLQKVGDNLYKIDDLANIEQSPNQDAVASGFLETSNVNAVLEMSSLIATHRFVEMYQKVMTSHMDDLNNDAINKLASTK